MDREFTLKEAWLQLCSRIVVNNKAVECEHLITWFHAVLTQTAKQGALVVQVTTNPQTAEVANIHHCKLVWQRRGLLLTDFPNLGQIVLQAGHQAVATNIDALVTDRQAKVAYKSLATATFTTNLLGAIGMEISLQLSQMGTE